MILTMIELTLFLFLLKLLMNLTILIFFWIISLNIRWDTRLHLLSEMTMKLGINKQYAAFVREILRLFIVAMRKCIFVMFVATIIIYNWNWHTRTSIKEKIIYLILSSIIKNSLFRFLKYLLISCRIWIE